MLLSRYTTTTTEGPRMSKREKYTKDGFLHPLTIFSPEKIADFYANYQDYVQQYGTDGKLSGDHRCRLHVVAKWARDIVFDPKLVTMVKDVLDTKNLLVWDSDLNIKAPRTLGFFSWHQDGTYAGHSLADDVLTAWVALSPASVEAGCMNFCPGSHHVQLQHYESKDPNNVLSIGQTIPEEIMMTLEDPVAAPLEPGQVSLHHWNCVHASGPNTTDQERVGLAIRYMRADGTYNPRGGFQEHATLVCGDYKGDYWHLDGEIEEEYGEKEWERHTKGMEQMTNNYFLGTASKGFKAQ